MSTLLEGLRQVLGVPDFYVNNQWDYALMIEYLVGALVLLVVVSSVFKILVHMFK